MTTKTPASVLREAAHKLRNELGPDNLCIGGPPTRACHDEACKLIEAAIADAERRGYERGLRAALEVADEKRALCRGERVPIAICDAIDALIGKPEGT